MLPEEGCALSGKRMLSILLAAVLLLLCAGWAGAEENAAKAFRMAGFDDTSMRDWSSNRFFTRMTEWTGVSFTFQQFNDSAAWSAYKAGLKPGSDLPDALFKASLTSSECISLREKGVLIDLKPLLEENAPHLWALLQENEEAMRAVTLPDGSIAALPYFNGLPNQNYLWINRQWLEQLHLSMPTTAEELETVLAAFQSRDPNRNGRKDEIPLGFLGPFDLKFLAHAYGLICDDYNVFARDGKVYFMPEEEAFRPFIAWCRKLYEQGLLDPNGFSTADTLRKSTDDNATPTYGVIMTASIRNLFQTSWADQYTVIPPLTYEGKQVYRDFFGDIQRGTFAITTACEDPAALLRWADILYTEEGAKLASAGQENLDYLVDGDGTWRLVDSATGNSTAFIANSLMDGGGSMPGITAFDFMLRFSGQSETYRANVLRQKEIRELFVRPMPYVTLTEEQENKVSALQAGLGRCVDLHIARWVLGEEEISDASFAQFHEELEQLGLREFMAFWQEILDAQQGGN